MKPSELSAALREMADKIDSIDFPPGMDFKCEITAHWCDLQRLQAMAKLMSPVRADRDGSTCWIYNHRSSDNENGIEITAFYKPGLLGAVKRERIVETEDRPDLSVLQS